MEVIKIGSVSSLNSIIMIDNGTKYYDHLKVNHTFFKKYKTMNSKNVINMEVYNISENIEIYNIIEFESLVGNARMLGFEKVMDIIDNLIITEHYLYMIIDKAYLRNKILNKLGI